jgi:hypothetical protein
MGSVYSQPPGPPGGRLARPFAAGPLLFRGFSLSTTATATTATKRSQHAGPQAAHAPIERPRPARSASSFGRSWPAGQPWSRLGAEAWAHFGFSVPSTPAITRQSGYRRDSIVANVANSPRPLDSRRRASRREAVLGRPCYQSAAWGHPSRVSEGSWPAGAESGHGGIEFGHLRPTAIAGRVFRRQGCIQVESVVSQPARPTLGPGGKTL